MRIALGLEYCGTSFTGWQTQPDGRGVQDALERALAAIAAADVGTVAAGRTDAGVHATMQVVGEYVYTLDDPRTFRRDPSEKQNDPRISELMALGLDQLIVKILVENAQPVQYDDPMFVIKPA